MRRYSPIVRELWSRNVHWSTATCQAGLGVGGGWRRASLLLPPPPLPYRTLYCTSVQFTNFVRELLVNIAYAVPHSHLVVYVHCILCGKFTASCRRAAAKHPRLTAGKKCIRLFQVRPGPVPCNTLIPYLGQQTSKGGHPNFEAVGCFFKSATKYFKALVSEVPAL